MFDSAFSSELFLIVSVVFADIRKNVESLLSQVKMNFGSRLDDLQKNIDETTVVKIGFEEIKLGGLQDGFHASGSPLVIRVHLHHFNEVLM